MRRRSSRAIVAVVGVGLAAVGVGLTISQGGHPGGDPGGRILHALRPATDAVPSDAKVINSLSAEPYWDDCRGSESYSCTRPGWGLVNAVVEFTTKSAAEPLLRHADAVLTAQGWCLSSRESSPLGPVLTWAKMVPGGRWGWATLSPGDQGPGSPLTWDLSASAPALGPGIQASPLSDPPCRPAGAPF